MAHFSKFVRPKAVRIASSSYESIRSVAFKNTDGSIAVILFNDSEQTGNVELKLQEESVLSFQLEAKSAMTVFIQK